MAMAATFEASKEEPLPERLVRALEAGQAAGGDKRGKQSAAVTTVKDQPYPYVDLRVDEHPDPVVELRRIYEVVTRHRCCPSSKPCPREGTLKETSGRRSGAL